MNSALHSILVFVQSWWVELLCAVLIVLVVPLIAGYIVLVERKVMADMQARLGPMRVGPHGLLQPIADAVKLLLDLGARATDVDNNGDTALHGPAYRGSNEAVKLLVNAGAKLDARNKLGWSPLTIATGVYFNCRVVMNKHTAKLLQDLMVARGLDPSQKGVNTNGQRPDQSGAVQCASVVDDLVDAQNPSEVQQRLLGEQMKREEVLKRLQNQAQ